MQKLSLIAVALGLFGADAFQLPQPAFRSQRQSSRYASPAMIEFDTSTIVGLGAAFVGIGGGVGLIAFTENAGKRNEAKSNAQPCVECKGEKVLPCTLCKGSGVDPFASLVAGVKEMVDGDEGPKGNRILVDDWDEGQKEVEMYAEILGQYPVKATESVCMTCTGKGVVVCDNAGATEDVAAMSKDELVAALTTARQDSAKLNICGNLVALPLNS